MPRSPPRPPPRSPTTPTATPTARLPRTRSAARHRPPRPRRCLLPRRSYLRVLARERRAARLAGARRAQDHRRAPRAHRRAHIKGVLAARQPLFLERCDLGVLCVCSATRTDTLAPGTSGWPTSEWAYVPSSGTWPSVITSPNAAAGSRSALITSFTDTCIASRRAQRPRTANNVRADTTAAPCAPRSREATRPRRRGMRSHPRPPAAAAPPPAPSLRQPPSASSRSGAPR